MSLSIPGEGHGPWGLVAPALDPWLTGCVSSSGVTASAHLHDFAEHIQWIRLLLVIDKRKSQTDSFAKQAVAAFRISRSIRNRSFFRVVFRKFCL